MASESRLETPCWFVLNHIRIAFQDTARKAIERFNACQDSSLELFAPTYVVKEKKNNTINSLNEVEGFLNDFKHFKRYIHLYKFFK